PLLHAIAEAPRQELRVVGEPARAVGVEPPAPLKEREGIVPVKEGDVGLDVAREQRVDEAIVEIQAPLVGCARTLGQHARPAHARAIRVDAQGGEQLDVLRVAPVVIAGDAPVVAVPDRSGAVAERVPDAGPLTVEVMGTLDLIGGGCRTPDEVGGKVGHAPPLPSFALLEKRRSGSTDSWRQRGRRCSATATAHPGHPQGGEATQERARAHRRESAVAAAGLRGPFGAGAAGVADAVTRRAAPGAHVHVGLQVGLQRVDALVELAAVVDELPVAEEGSFGRAAGGLAGSLHARLARREPVGPGLTIHLTLDVGLRLAAPLAAGLTAGAAVRRGPLSLAAGFTAAGEGRLAAGFALAAVGGGLALAGAVGL